MMEVGDKIPEFTFKTCKIKDDGSCPSPTSISTSKIFEGRTIVLVGVPGAFTPVCSGKHVPGYIDLIEEFRARAVDEVAIVSVNDPFVMAHWAAHLNATDNLLMLADGNGEFVEMVGLGQDCAKWGMGVRGKRFAMIVKNGTVKYLGIDENGLKKSAASEVLKHLKE